MANQIPISIDFPPLPDGWRGDADDLLTFIKEHGTFKVETTGLTGQIGGARPVADVGIWINTADGTIEYWDGSEYAPITEVPIGAIMAWPSQSLVAPANYLFADGEPVSKTEYPKLFAVIGTAFNRVAEDSTVFRLPDMAGRTIVGAGTGFFSPKDITIGTLRETPFGYVGSPLVDLTNGWTGGHSAFYRYLVAPFKAGKVTEFSPPAVALKFIIKAK